MMYGDLFHKRIGAALPSVEERGGSAILTTRGTDVRSAGPVRIVTRASQDPKNLEPIAAPPPHGTSWASDDRKLALCVKSLERLGRIFRESDDPLSREEADFVEKVCLQRGGLFGWWARPESMGRRLQPRSLKECYRLLRTRVLEGHERWFTPHWTSVPKMSNSGYPWNRAGAEAKMVHAAFAAASGFDFNQLAHNLTEAGQRAGCEQPICATLFSRTGHTKKALTCYNTDESGTLLVSGTATGVAPRRRHVLGVPSSVNMGYMLQATGTTNWLQSHSSFSHRSPGMTLSKIAEACRRIKESGGLPTIYIDDISAFDQSVDAAHQEDLYDEVYEPLWTQGNVSPAGGKSAWLKSQWLPVLTPPIRGGNEGFLMTRAEGGETESGSIFTGDDGICHNGSCVISCLSAAFGCSNETAAQKWANGSVLVLIWGDDTLIVVDGRKFDAEAYVERAREHGYVRKLSIGGSFLAKFYYVPSTWAYIPKGWPTEPDWFAMASRVWANSAFREHPSWSTAHEVSGLFFRVFHNQANHNPYFEAVWSELSHAPDSCLTEWKMLSIDQLAGATEHPGIRRAVATADRARIYKELIDLAGREDRNDPGAWAAGEWLRRITGIAQPDESVDVSGLLAGAAHITLQDAIDMENKMLDREELTHG